MKRIEVESKAAGLRLLDSMESGSKGMEDYVTLDTEAAVRIGVEAMRKLIEADARG